MRRGLYILSLSAALSMVLPAAHAAQQEFYLVSGGGYFSSPARVVAGYGGGPGYRYLLSESVALHLELRWMGYLGNAWSLSTGATYGWSLGHWRPAAGLQLTGFVGDQVRIVSSSTPALAAPFAIALQARVAPLRFTRGAASASALGLDLGAGVDHRRGALALMVSFLEIGYRF